MSTDLKIPDLAPAIQTANTARPVRTLLMTAIAFAAAFVVSGFAFTAFAIFGTNHRAEPTGQLLANLGMASYLVMVSALLNALAFVGLVAWSGNWRRLSVSGAVSRSAFFGLIAFAISMTGLQYQILRAFPILNQIPLVGIWATIFLPGALMGALAVMAIWLGSIRAGNPSAKTPASRCRN